MRISDWSSDVCSSDLIVDPVAGIEAPRPVIAGDDDILGPLPGRRIGPAMRPAAADAAVLARIIAKRPAQPPQEARAPARPHRLLPVRRTRLVGDRPPAPPRALLVRRPPRPAPRPNAGTR